MRSPFFLHARDEELVHALERDGMKLQNIGNVVASLIYLGLAEHDENAARTTEHEPNLRFQNGDASGLAANQSASNVEATIFTG